MISFILRLTLLVGVTTAGVCKEASHLLASVSLIAVSAIASPALRSNDASSKQLDWTMFELEKEAPQHSPIFNVADSDVFSNPLPPVTNLIESETTTRAGGRVEFDWQTIQHAPAARLADETWEAIKKKLGKTGGIMSIANVPTRNRRKTTVELVCTESHDGDGISWDCDDPCSITLRFSDYPENKGGVTARWSYIDSILYKRESLGGCLSGMLNYDVQFAGRDMIELANAVSEHSGFRHQYLVDGASYPCGDRKNFIRARDVGLFTQGVTFYMKHGYYPLHRDTVTESEDADMNVGRRAWCKAKEIAMSTTVATALQDECLSKHMCVGACMDDHYDTMHARFSKMVQPTLERSCSEFHDWDQMTLGQAYKTLDHSARKQTGEEQSVTCDRIDLLQHIMVLGGGTRTSGVAAFFKHTDVSDQCKHISEPLVTPLYWPHYARFTDGWLLDNGERIRPTTPWKAYCGFTQEELDQLTLAIGDSCNRVEGVELSSKEANVACGDGVVCSTKGVCCVPPKEKPTLIKDKRNNWVGDKKSCCTGRLSVDESVCR